MKITESTRILGVHITPSLNWKGQFEIMKKKVHTAITKLMNTQINPFQAAIFYHTYMIKSAFFGCGIIELNEKQNDALKQIYEEPLLMKLGLSRKFPRKILYSRKSALGVGIMTPLTIIAMLKAKLYLGNVRAKGVTNEAVQLHEEMVAVKAGRKVQIGGEQKYRYWNSTWIDEVSNVFKKRQIHLHQMERSCLKTRNKTVMDYALEYVQVKNLKQKVLDHLNFVRLKKQLVLPFKLVGTEGIRPNEYYRDINKQSQLKWQ